MPIPIAEGGGLVAFISIAIAIIIWLRLELWMHKFTKALPSLAGLKDHPEWVGKAIAAAYPPEAVAGMVSAVITDQHPYIMDFIEKEGIPLLAAIGGGQVAEDARLARSVKKLGSGATGLQGLMGLVTAPSKKSGIGDLLSYLPLIQQFMGPGGPLNKGSGSGSPLSYPAPSGGNGGGTVKW